MYAAYLHVRNHASTVTSMTVIVAHGVTATWGSGRSSASTSEQSKDTFFWKGFLTARSHAARTGVRWWSATRTPA